MSLLLFSYGVGQFEIRRCPPVSHWQQWWYLTSFLHSKCLEIPPALQPSLCTDAMLCPHSTHPSLGSKPNAAKQANPFPLAACRTSGFGGGFSGALPFWLGLQVLLLYWACQVPPLSILTPQRDDETLGLAMFQSSVVHRAGAACRVAVASRGEG